MSQDQNPEVLKQWLDANPDKKGTPDYDTVELGYNRLVRVAGYRKELETANRAEAAGIVADYLINVGKDFAKVAAIKGGPAALGQVFGGILGERVAGKAGRKIGERVGGGAGSGVGSVAYQMSERGKVSGGETLADVVAGVTQAKSMTTAGLSNMALDVVRQKIDEGTVDWSEAAAAGAAGMASSQIANRIAGKAVDPQDAVMVNRIKAFEDVRPYGVVINPAELATELSVAQRVSIPSATSAKAAHFNQVAWQKMAREQAELPIDGELVFKPTTYKLGPKNKILGTIDEKIEEVSQPYRDIAEISKGVVEEIKQQQAGILKNPKYLGPNVTAEGVELMVQAKKNLDDIREIRYQRKAAAKRAALGDPNAQMELRVLVEREAAIESQLEKAAVAAGDADLIDRLTAARQKIAVLKVIDDATTTYGTVDPSVVFALRQSGAPLSGNLEKIALFYDAFKPSATEIVQAGPVQGMGVSTAYTARNIATGNPTGAIAAGIPVVSEAVRDFMLAEQQQKAALRPALTQRPDSAAAALVRQAGAMGAMEIENTPENERVRALIQSQLPMNVTRYMMNPAPMIGGGR